MILMMMMISCLCANNTNRNLANNKILDYKVRVGLNAVKQFSSPL